MKIDINKDFEESFPNEIYSGFTLGQCLAAAIGLAMAAGAAFLLWKTIHIPIVECTYLTIPLMIPACAVGFFRYQGQNLPGIIREILFAGKTRRLSYAAGEYAGSRRIFTLKQPVKRPEDEKKPGKKKDRKGDRRKEKRRKHRKKADRPEERKEG